MKVIRSARIETMISVSVIYRHRAICCDTPARPGPPFEGHDKVLRYIGGTMPSLPTEILVAVIAPPSA
jgi:hypothetical protein